MDGNGMGDILFACGGMCNSCSLGILSPVCRKSFMSTENWAAGRLTRRRFGRCQWKNKRQ